MVTWYITLVYCLEAPFWTSVITNDLSKATTFHELFIIACFWHYYCSFLTTDPLTIQIHYCQTLTARVTSKQQFLKRPKTERWKCTFHFRGRFERSDSRVESATCSLKGYRHNPIHFRLQVAGNAWIFSYIKTKPTFWKISMSWRLLSVVLVFYLQGIKFVGSFWSPFYHRRILVHHSHVILLPLWT